MKYATLLLILFLFCANLLAQIKEINHPDCRLRILTEQSKKYPQLMELILEHLKTAKYNPYRASKFAPTVPGDLYFDFKKEMLGSGIFPPCEVGVKIFKSKEKSISRRDKILYEHSFKRKHPRLTFSGIERCRRAIRDVMERFPVCLPPKAK